MLRKFRSNPAVWLSKQKAALTLSESQGRFRVWLLNGAKQALYLEHPRDESRRRSPADVR